MGTPTKEVEVAKKMWDKYKEDGLCPNCDSSSVRCDDFEFDKDSKSIAKYMLCERCNAYWDDIYDLKLVDLQKLLVCEKEGGSIIEE